MNPDATRTPPAVRLERFVPAPPEKVFAAWTRPDLLARWYAPAPASVGAAEVDLRVGGAWRIRMDAPEGRVYTAHGVYRAIDAPRRLVFTFDWAEEENRMGVETVVTVDFQAVDGGTRVALAHEGLPGTEAAEGHASGWTACLDRLASALAGLRA